MYIYFYAFYIHRMFLLDIPQGDFMHSIAPVYSQCSADLMIRVVWVLPSS